jgi:large subunit ribosomal protein L30e
MKEIVKALKDGKLLVGSRSVLKGIKAGNVKEVFYANNCPGGTLKDLNHYSEASKIEVKKFEESSVRLGEICGKPFSVLLIGIKK